MYEYILTSYRSLLVCIGGYIYNHESCKYMKNNKVYALTRDGWRDNIVSPIQDSDEVPFGKVSASSEGEILIMAWEESCMVKLMYFDGQQWKKAEGPQCRSSGVRINLIIHKGAVFLTAQRDAVHSTIYKAPVESALSDTYDYSRIVWNEVQGTLYSYGLSYLSNLTVLGERIVILHPQPQLLGRIRP